MLVNTYDIFGDYYVITVASLGEGQWRGRGLEIPDNRFLDVMQLASSLARGKEEERRKRIEKTKKIEGILRILPLSGNDKKPFEQALSCLNIPTQSTISEILGKANPDMAKKECQKVSAPSFVKPEMYEYGKYPGYRGSTKVEVKVDPVYLVVAVAGWVISRLGEAMISNSDRVGIHLFPVSVDRQFSVLPSLVKDSPLIPGFYPSTAFLLWLAYQMVSRKAEIRSGINIYAVSDAGGQSPTTVVGGFTTSVERLLENKIFRDEQAYAVEAVTREALRYDSGKRDYAIRISNLLYEVLMGSRRSEELMYFANRELLSINLTKSKEDKRLYEMMSMLARKIAEV
ncbi:MULTISPECIES: type I-A CRISPR-associated protein CsaX [Metallosphaera]|uniref:CRISPR-associated protein n=2 Tax=Metallosphaera TaxID=41980 RepID=A4YFU8_METS5|nr:MULTISPECIES: type I-A CRISPR-associated protein CsaX [Metallosphaera]ABP95300.1 hypothetical protein Msed_1139 [Metallosphaera sedula DSM 5348]QCO29211.1 type I-A CRISPR-associated protein CsaX [Metallosphaera prunae]BBL47170.1 CRISPR-associated protein CsaX [Metallosphaera sedula]